MRILITGSRGFVGGSFGRFAAPRGHAILGVGRASQPEPDWPGLYVQADVALADLSAIIDEFAPEALFHAAGTASVGASLETPLDDLRAAVLTWANTLEGVRRSRLKPLLLFPSSGAVYGNPAQLPVGEDAAIAPISPYGFHKAACELLAREYATCFGLDIVVCRFFSLFGVAQRRLLVWELFKQFAGPDPTVWLQGSGTESRDYLHIDEAAAAVLQLAAEHTDNRSGGSCLFFNVASGEETEIRSVAGQIGALVAPAKEIRYRGLSRPGDPRRWRADISRLRACVPGWQPSPLSASLARCVAAWQKELHPVRYGN
ncbi:MAG TPA: NAD-dependent epimerase/dehydratase family protein [Pyrinomonadaceae bacterium]|jgi:UDP-glucose 4-epimerase|nr:NAD-dependent epimerase/dehydratase family protein [Pyrinomonadaceae bacterium]